MDMVIGIVAIGGLMGLLWWVRKVYREWNAEEPGSPTGFTLGDLRDMRKKGQISEAEFAKAKEALITATKKPATAPAKPAQIADFQSKGVGLTGGFPVGPERPSRHTPPSGRPID